MIRAAMVLTAWLVACVSVPAAAAVETIVVGGSGGPTTALVPVVEAFQRVHPSIQVKLQPSIGSRGGIRAAAQGAIAIGVASRELGAEGAGLVAIEFARTPLVFAVGAGSPETGVTVQQLADMYQGKMVAWPDGRRVRVVLRPSSDADTVTLRALSPALREASMTADARPGMLMAMTDMDSTEHIESIAGAIGTTTLAQLLTEKRRIKALTLDGVAPTVENARTGRYPASKKFIFVLRPPLTPPAQAFLDFVRGPEGRRILERHGQWVVPGPD